MDLVGLLPFVAIAALFWLLLIRPASRRQKEVLRMQGAVAVGDRVVLTSGIHGEIVDVGDEALDVEVAPGVVLVVARGALGSVRHDEPIDDELDHDADHEAIDGPADDVTRADDVRDDVRDDTEGRR